MKLEPQPLPRPTAPEGLSTSQPDLLAADFGRPAFGKAVISSADVGRVHAGRGRRRGSALGLVLATALAATPAGADTGRTLTRRLDVVTAPGKLLSALGKPPLRQLGCFAASSASAARDRRVLDPIPCQLDERTAAGAWILTEGPEANAEESDGVLSPQDELVFLSADAGDQVEQPLFPVPAQRYVELQVLDPQDHRVGWVYVATFAQEAPRASKDYVQYRPQQGEVETAVYTLGFSKQAPLVFDRVILHPQGGGSGKNPIDRMKVRLDAKVWDTIPIHKTEDDYTSSLMGYIDGPVRVLRRTRNRLVLFWKIPSPSAVQDNFFYPYYFEFPILVSLPLDLDTFLSEATLRISVDLNGSEQRQLVNSRNRTPILLDGQTGPAEKSLDTRPYGWSVVSGVTSSHPAGWFNRLSVGANTPIEPYLYFQDERASADAPEAYPGHFGDVGYEVRQLRGLKKGVHRLTSVLYWMPRYEPGMEAQYLSIQDAPLQLSVTRTSGG